MIAAALDLGVDGSTWPWIWLGVAVVLALVELFFVPGSFILFPWSITALVASIIGFIGVDVTVQWAVFVIGGAVLFFFMYRWAKRFNETDSGVPGMGADRLVGLTGLVTVAIDPHDVSRAGKVAVEGESWGALTDGPSKLNEGTEVVITEMRGTRVVVEPS